MSIVNFYFFIVNLIYYIFILNSIFIGFFTFLGVETRVNSFLTIALFCIKIGKIYLINLLRSKKWVKFW